MRKLIPVLVLATMPFTAFAEKTFDASLSPVDFSVNFDVNPDDLIDGETIGDSVQVRELQLGIDGDINQWLYGRITTEINNSLGGISEDDLDLDTWLKEAYVGTSVNALGQTVMVLVGRQSLAFGGNVTQNPVNTSDTNYALSKENDRYMAITIALNPNVQVESKAVRAVTDLFQSLEMTCFDDASQADLNIGDLGDINSCSFRARGSISTLLTQMSYMDKDNGETRMSLSAEHGIGGKASVYGEAQQIRNSPTHGDQNAYTVGVAGHALKGRLSLEYTGVDQKKGVDTSGIQDNNRVTVGYRHQTTKNLSLGAQCSIATESSSDDVECLATAQVTAGTARAQNIFPESMVKRANSHNAYMDSVNAAKAKK